MTPQEAIKRIEEFGLHHAIGDLPYSAHTVEAFEMAISALEKQDVSEINVGDMISRQAEPLELQFEQVGTHIIKTCPTCNTPWRVPPTSEYLNIAKYPCCPCGQRIKWEWRDE